MAFHFNGSTSYLEIGKAVLSAPPLTFACRFRSSVASQDGCLISIADSVSGSTQFELRTTSPGNRPVRAFTQQISGLSDSAASVAGYYTGPWQSAAAVFTASNSRRALQDGVSGATNTNNYTLTGLDRTNFGCSWDSGARYNFFTGWMKDAAIWLGALSDSELRLFHSGVRPNRIRPGWLFAWLPMDLNYQDRARCNIITANAVFPQLDYHRLPPWILNQLTDDSVRLATFKPRTIHY